jgi:hypothetical protein
LGYDTRPTVSLPMTFELTDSGREGPLEAASNALEASKENGNGNVEADPVRDDGRHEDPLEGLFDEAQHPFHEAADTANERAFNTNTDAPHDNEQRSPNLNINRRTNHRHSSPFTGERVFDDAFDNPGRALDEPPPNSPASSYLTSPPNSPKLPTPPPSSPPPEWPLGRGKSVRAVKELKEQHERRMAYNREHGRPLHDLTPEEEEEDIQEEERYVKFRLAEAAKMRKAKAAEKLQKELMAEKVIHIDVDEEEVEVPQVKSGKKYVAKPSRVSPPRVTPKEKKAVKQPKRKFVVIDDEDEDENFEEVEESGDDDDDELWAPNKKARRQEARREAKMKPIQKKRKVVTRPVVVPPKTVARPSSSKSKHRKTKVPKKERHHHRRSEKHRSLMDKVIKRDGRDIRKQRHETAKKTQRTALEKAVRSAKRNAFHSLPVEERPILPSVDEEDLYLDSTDWGSESEVEGPSKPQVDFIYTYYPQFATGRGAWMPSLEKVVALIQKEIRPANDLLFLACCVQHQLFDIHPETGAIYEKERERRFRALELLEQKGFVPNLRTFEVTPSGRL